MAEAGKTCLKCGHVRAANDPAPAYECPKCGAIYKKMQNKERESFTHLPPLPVANTSSGTHWGKLALVGVVVALVVGGYLYKKSSSAPTPPPPEARKSEPAPPPKVDKVYDDPTQYAKEQVVVTLGEVQGRAVSAKVVNRGKQHLGTITVKVHGLKEWVPDPMFLKDKTPEAWEVDLTNSPFYAESTKESLLEFPKGINTLVFPGRPIKEEAMEVPRRVPVVKAAFFY
ncbi:MAG: hypothetical protein G8345_19030 [Magnetococcales bacterium]|nr:hypothetical protein [Magnetococcales bacterium]